MVVQDWLYTGMTTWQPWLYKTGDVQGLQQGSHGCTRLVIYRDDNRAAMAVQDWLYTVMTTG